MCLAIPGKIIKIAGRKAIVQYPGEQRVALVGEEGLKVGDHVMVQMGIIVKKISSIEAGKMLTGKV
ncbi:HypC/HybG/HupF family hydrogenase formation chaperone [Candidatus Microgenomates bacterium]|nr:HypC/HybG/HupF family hydrogenase formation chaperone [Candidatus Microgenomates bacterium]